MASSDPRQRLLELAEARHASLAQLSALIGRNASYLQQFVRKGSPRKLEENDRRTLARFFGVTEAELGGTEEISYGLPGGPRRQEPRRQDWADVPRLALGASAGPGALAGGEDAVGTLRFSTQWLRGMGLDPARLRSFRWPAIRWSRPCAMATRSWSTAAACRCAMASTWCGWMMRCWSSGSMPGGPAGWP